jgi:hypothetical protein
MYTQGTCVHVFTTCMRSRELTQKNSSLLYYLASWIIISEVCSHNLKIIYYSQAYYTHVHVHVCACRYYRVQYVEIAQCPDGRAELETRKAIGEQTWKVCFYNQSGNLLYIEGNDYIEGSDPLACYTTIDTKRKHLHVCSLEDKTSDNITGNSTTPTTYPGQRMNYIMYIHRSNSWTLLTYSTIWT